MLPTVHSPTRADYLLALPLARADLPSASSACVLLLIRVRLLNFCAGSKQPRHNQLATMQTVPVNHLERDLVRQVQLLALALMRHLLLEDRAFELCHVSS